MIGPPLKWHGGKHYLASRIVAIGVAWRRWRIGSMGLVNHLGEK